MKTNLSKPILIAVGVLITILVLWIVIQKVRINKMSDANQLQNVELSTLKDSVLSVVTKNGQLISTIQSVQVEKDNLKDALEIAGFDKKQLRKDNIKLRDLTLALKAQLEASGSIETTVHDTFYVDGIDTVYYTKVDDWTDNKLSIYGGTIQKNKLNFERYTFTTGFEFFLTEQKNKSIVTVKFPDESIRLTTANSITVTHKKKWYERPVVWAAVGLGTGVLIAK